MSSSAAEAQLGLLSLDAGGLSQILRRLSLRDVCNTAQACRQLHQAALDESVWQSIAAQRYPPATLRLAPYDSWRELVRDDNAEHAALLLPLPDRACLYRFRAPSYYFECLCLGLEWDRGAHTFRLYFEARGEADLRQPGESSLGFCVHRPPPPNRRELQRRLRLLQQRRAQLQRELAAARAADARSSILAAEHALQRNAVQTQTAQSEMGRPHELRFADLLTVVRPSGQRLLVDVPGHKLGYLEFDSLHQVDNLLAELPPSYASKHAAEVCGIDAVFCFANPIPVMPHGAVVDYEPCILATVPPGTSLLAVFKREGGYAVPGLMLEELSAEGPEARRARWEHLPPEVLQRQPPWLV